jgi:hypothetical protein
MNHPTLSASQLATTGPYERRSAMRSTIWFVVVGWVLVNLVLTMLWVYAVLASVFYGIGV